MKDDGVTINAAIRLISPVEEPSRARFERLRSGILPQGELEEDGVRADRVRQRWVEYDQPLFFDATDHAPELHQRSLDGITVLKIVQRSRTAGRLHQSKLADRP